MLKAINYLEMILHLRLVTNLIPQCGLWNHTNLIKGENFIHGLSLRLEWKIKSNSYDEKLNQIIPMGNLDDVVQHRFRMTYNFANSSLVSYVDIALTSRNNSHCNLGWSPYDGDVAHVKAKTGEIKNVVLIPEKYIFDPNIEKCRDKPYNDIIS